MITKLAIEDWKSFHSAVLHIDSLSVMIGTNAGGKSNALDALEFLGRTASGLSLTACLSGDANIVGLRGGIEWASRDQTGSFSLGVLVEKDSGTEYEYTLSASVVESRCEVYKEELVRNKVRKKKNGERITVGTVRIFKTDDGIDGEPMLKVRLYNSKGGALRQVSRSSSVLSQLRIQSLNQEVNEAIHEVSSALLGVFKLDPIPSHMRKYTVLSDTLEADAGNIAGVIAALPSSVQREIEDVFQKYLSRLPEREIVRVFAEKVGRYNTDAMLYCEENWGAGAAKPIIDARGMSDGTLRFLAILAALMTRPKGSLLVIEEVDNGLHPSRAYLLLEMLQKIGDERGVDVLVTTHNPALLDAMGPSLVPFITVAHRELRTGVSLLTLLENVDNLARVLGQGPLGTLSSKGIIERALRGEQLKFEF